MNILGVGGWELAAILIIMLVVAGPKRMIQWAYIMGTYVAKMRQMWAETALMIQKEFDEAGVDIKVPQDIPTKRDIARGTQKLLSPVTDPLQQTVDEVKADIQNARTPIPAPDSKSDAPKKAPASKTSEKAVSSFGSWSGNGSDNGNGSGKPADNFGTWSGPAVADDDEGR